MPRVTRYLDRRRDQVTVIRGMAINAESQVLLLPLALDEGEQVDIELILVRDEQPWAAAWYSLYTPSGTSSAVGVPVRAGVAFWSAVP